jgi:hypothetical protein
MERWITRRPEVIPDVGDELDAHARIREVVADTGRRVASIIDPVVPTASFLASLADELAAARADEASVPHPELLDPEAYWEATVKPQGSYVRRTADEVLEYAEARILAHVAEAESELEAIVGRRAQSTSAADGATRAAVIDDIATHCQTLHHLVAGLIAVLPPADQLEIARQGYDDARRRRAVSDVETLKPIYLREAGGDENHQRFAEQQWTETFADRVSHRDLMLRAEVPWRHQELALIGYERVREHLEATVDDAVARLQQPLLEVGARLVRLYDTAATQSV